MSKQYIIIRPILSEKSTNLDSDIALNKYTFEVDRSANKIEIKTAVEKQFGVKVTDVNTYIRPGKSRSRIVKGRQTKGQTSASKRAVVTVADGEMIDGFYGADEQFDSMEDLELNG